jgi:hypothetical protein
MPQIGLSRKRKLAIAAVCLVVVLIEVYAHSYVPVYELSVVPKNQARVERSGPAGSYEFVKSNCRWLVRWVMENPTLSNSYNAYFWVWLYKIAENTRLLSSRTDILVSGVTVASTNHSVVSLFDLDEDVL